uniref:Pro-MCH 2-like n=1 Tax=Neolamprologus brichardi TaxID=32507 RepID=A0A3Q4HC90_NEOBR
MISVYSVFLTLLLFTELSSHSVTVAMPATNAEDGTTEEDGLGLILGDESISEPAVIPPVFRQRRIRDEDGNPTIIISDARLKGHSVRGLNPAFTRSLPLHADRSLSHTPAEYSVKIDRRDTDLDMLRCMIGRVYRPSAGSAN